MAEPAAAWTSVARELANVVIRGVPQRFLRWRWAVPKLLGALTIIADPQPPMFCIGKDLPSHDLEGMTFHVFNFSPLRLALVGAELDVTIHSTGLLVSNERFATGIPLEPISRGGFPFRKTLNERQSQMVMQEKGDFVRTRVTGNVIVKSPFGEHRKELHADVVVSLVR